MALYTAQELADHLNIGQIRTATVNLHLPIVTALLAAEVTVTDPPNPIVKGVALTVAARAYQTAPGIIAETLDDYSWKARDIRPGIYLDADDRAVLRGLSGWGAVYSVPLYAPALIDPVTT